MEDLSEKEQIDSIRAWWSEYGNFVIAGIVVGALLLFGWNYYKTSTANKEIAASMLYDELADHVAEGRVAEAERVSAELDAQFPETAYASQADLAMARLYMDNNRDADAAGVLRALVDSRASHEFGAIARLRLAKVLQYQEKYEEVLDLLDVDDTPGFTARYAAARGDALEALERYDEAREQYLIALADNGQTTDTTFLQLKLLDLPATQAAASGDEPAADGDVELPETDANETDASETDANETDANETDANEADANETNASETNE